MWSFKPGLTDKAKSVKLEKTSMRSAMERDRNHRVLASIDSCCLSCPIAAVIKDIVLHNGMVHKGWTPAGGRQFFFTRRKPNGSLGGSSGGGINRRIASTMAVICSS